MPRASALILIAFFAFASPANAQDALQWSGFALVRGSNGVESGPLREEELSSQLQIGIDWLPSPFVGAHLHLLARDDDAGARRGRFGIPQAYIEGNLRPWGGRLRLRGGAFFLPTSRENVDALWETAYSITPSVLNSWLGEEFRPIGIDAQYTRNGLMAGATIYRGNDTFGALPVDRGWTLRDHWATLGEWIPTQEGEFTSISAENDHRLGWSARAAWIGARALVQLTHIDNRSDGVTYGQLENWGTRFEILSAEYTHDDWTIAAEAGWGPTFVIGTGVKYVTDLETGYVLVSRRFPHGRATVRAEAFVDDDTQQNAFTFAFLWNAPGRFRPGIELTTSGGEHRAIIELRYRFSGR